jgi:hypothetical protein
MLPPLFKSTSTSRWWRLRERAEHGLLLAPYLLGAGLLLVLPGLLTLALALILRRWSFADDQ